MKKLTTTMVERLFTAWQISCYNYHKFDMPLHVICKCPLLKHILHMVFTYVGWRYCEPEIKTILILLPLFMIGVNNFLEIAFQYTFSMFRFHVIKPEWYLMLISIFGSNNNIRGHHLDQVITGGGQRTYTANRRTIK